MLILSLVSIFFVRNRKREIGILMSLGESKLRVVSQFILEIVLVSMLAVSLSMISGNKMGDIVSTKFMQMQIDTEAELKYEQENGDVVTQIDMLEAYEVSVGGVNSYFNSLEDAVASLEGGYGGVAVSSGMAAVNTVYMAFLSQGKHLVAHNSLYGPSRGVMESIYPKFGVESTFVDATDIENVKNAIRENTALIYLETPANPTMGIMDIEAICKFMCTQG